MPTIFQYFPQFSKTKNMTFWKIMGMGAWVIFLYLVHTLVYVISLRSHDYGLSKGRSRVMARDWGGSKT